jgi:N utilization substance protein B
MPKISRRESREAAVILLYQKDLLEKDVSELLENDRLNDKFFDDFALRLINGVDANLKEIDKVICGTVENWSLDRIAVIDRNILRVAIYEMLHEKDIPLKVSVDEAIEIAKSLGQKDDTPKFINGVLGKFLNRLSEANDKGPE